jgi:hypothetical protein
MSTDYSASIVSKVWNYPPPPSGLRRAGSEMTELGFDYPDHSTRITIA